MVGEVSQYFEFELLTTSEEKSAFPGRFLVKLAPSQVVIDVVRESLRKRSGPTAREKKTANK